MFVLHFNNTQQDILKISIGEIIVIGQGKYNKTFLYLCTRVKSINCGMI